MKNVIRSFALAVLVLAPAQLVAQSSTTRGFQLGFQAQGAALSVEGGDEANAGGGGIRAGYGLNRTITLFFQADGAQFDVDDADDDVQGTWTLAHADFGARFHFANSLRRWIPYLEAALTARRVTLKDIPLESETEGEISFSGPAFTFGGGVSFYINESLSLDLNAKLSSGEFTDIQVGAVSASKVLDLDATSSRFGLGLVFWL